MTEGGARRVKMDSVYDVRTPGGRIKAAFWKLVRAGAKGPDDHVPDQDDCPDDQDDTTVQLGVSQGGILVDVSYDAHAIAACGYSVFLKAHQTASFLRRGAPSEFRTGRF
jgi:hypothetical protein